MRFRPPVVVALLLVLAGAPACPKEQKKPPPKEAKESPSPSPSPSPMATRASFTATSVIAEDPRDRPQANEKASAAAAGIVDLVNAYYTFAFVNPDKWADGTHPDLAGLFAGPVRAQAAAQIQALALGDLAGRMKSVTPTKQEVSIKVTVEDDLSTPLASAMAFFEATGETKEKADGPVKIVHVLRVLLTPEGGFYKIAGGTAELKADTAASAMRPVDRQVTFGAAW